MKLNVKKKERKSLHCQGNESFYSVICMFIYIPFLTECRKSLNYLSDTFANVH